MTFGQALQIVERDYRAISLVPVYWERDEFDCDASSRALMRADTVHVHVGSDRRACLSLLAYRLEYEATLRATGYAPEPRYRCFRGPGGLIRGVVHDGRSVSDLWGPR